MTTTEHPEYTHGDAVTRANRGVGVAIRMDDLTHIFVQWAGRSMVHRTRIEYGERYTPPPAPVRRRRRVS